MNQAREGKVRLRDGRNLAYHEYGQISGYPILLFHGTPGSRLWFIDDEPISHELGIRLLALDRPGYGGSDPQPDRNLFDWVNDVKEAVQHWQLHEYSVLGVSGGGAYAAACAYHAPLGLRSAALVSSVMPFVSGKPPRSMSRINRAVFWLCRYMPWLMRSTVSAQAKMIDKDPQRFKKSLREGNRHLPASDRAVLQHEEQQEAMMLHMREAYRQGPDELVRENLLLGKPWGFTLADIHLPTYVFHGTQDTLAPYEEMVRYTAGAGAIQVTTVKEAGHFLTEDERIWREILLALRDGQLQRC